MDKNSTEKWFHFASATQIKKRKVYTFNYFGKSFVCYRDSKNSINVFDAHCPHLGAHLGVGGKIENNLLVCPFHGWKYDSSGQCVQIPYCEKIPKRAQLQSYPVKEVDSLIFFYMDQASESFKIETSSANVNLSTLNRISLKDFLTTRMDKMELQTIINKAKALFNFKSYGAGLFMVKSKLSHISLFVTATPVNNEEFSVSFAASVEKNFINLFRSCFIRQKAKKRFEMLFNSGMVV